MNRTDVLNELAAKIEARRYLEIGVRNPADNFDRIEVGEKVGVDPRGHEPVLRMTSDAFFQEWDRRKKFDLIFIDGDHGREQSRKDLANAVKVVSQKGYIVLHDCYPRSLQAALPEKTDNGFAWNGEVYRTFLEARADPSLVAYCVDCDHGVGVIQKGATKGVCVIPPVFVFRDFLANAKAWLGLVDEVQA